VPSRAVSRLERPSNRQYEAWGLGEAGLIARGLQMRNDQPEHDSPMLDRLRFVS